MVRFNKNLIFPNWILFCILQANEINNLYKYSLIAALEHRKSFFSISGDKNNDIAEHVRKVKLLLKNGVQIKKYHDFIYI